MLRSTTRARIWKHAHTAMSCTTGPPITLATIFQMAASISTSEKNLNYERLLYRRFVRSLNNLNQRRQQVLTVFKGGADPGFSIVCHCCGATEGSEQQHNQDLKEIYKGRRILEFITFYHNALHLTTFFTTMHCI